MAKPNQHKTWLNIVIITVSGLILAFTLLGKFFDSGTSAQATIDQSATYQYELVGIDFGQLQLKKDSDSWRSEPKGSLNQTQLELISSQWELLLSKDIQKTSLDRELSIQSASTVLLYLKDETRPIICKVFFAGEYAIVEFLASGQKLQLSASFAQWLLPPENTPSHFSREKAATSDEETDA